MPSSICAAAQVFAFIEDWLHAKQARSLSTVANEPALGFDVGAHEMVLYPTQALVSASAVKVGGPRFVSSQALVAAT